jgi:hypothetical protein
MNGAMSKQKLARRAAAISAAMGLVVAAVLLVAPAAQAAPVAAPAHPVQFSSDGAHWSNSYTDALFGGVQLVPGGSVDRAFYVRNGSDEPAVLRVTLFDVATTDIALAAAMSLTTSLPGMPGSAVPVTDARPCATLSQGLTLAAGDSVKLDNNAALADLTGTTGQSKTVSFKLAISLSSADAAAPAPDTCPTDTDTDTGTGTVVGAPDPGTGTGAGSRPVYHLVQSGWTPVSGSASADLPKPAQPAPTLDTALVVNSARLFQEYFVALWLAMAAVGALLFFLVRRRRPDDAADDRYSYSRQPTTQIGTGR